MCCEKPKVCHKKEQLMRNVRVASMITVDEKGVIILDSIHSIDPIMRGLLQLINERQQVAKEILKGADATQLEVLHELFIYHNDRIKALLGL